MSMLPKFELLLNYFYYASILHALRWTGMKHMLKLSVPASVFEQDEKRGKRMIIVQLIGVEGEI